MQTLVDAALASDEWRVFSGTFDLSVGPRSHRNVISMQTGVPAVFVPPDMRVQEMVDFAGLLCVSPTTLNEIESISDVSPFCSLEQFWDGATARRYSFERFLNI